MRNESQDCGDAHVTSKSRAFEVGGGRTSNAVSNACNRSAEPSAWISTAPELLRTQPIKSNERANR
jgi:hypothetical protein